MFPKGPHCESVPPSTPCELSNGMCPALEPSLAMRVILAHKAIPYRWGTVPPRNIRGLSRSTARLLAAQLSSDKNSPKGANHLSSGLLGRSPTLPPRAKMAVPYGLVTVLCAPISSIDLSSAA